MLLLRKKNCKYKHFGDGSKWTLKYLTDNKNLFKGKTLHFELPANVDDLGMRYFDVADISDANKILFYEFKSVAKVPPAHFAEQFLKDLSNKDVTSLDQIKWIFDGKKNPIGAKKGQSFKEAMEEAIDNLPLIDGTPVTDGLVKKFGVKDSDELKNLIENNFDKIFNLINDRTSSNN